MIETILVATDGSEDSSAAERTAMGLATRLGARLSGVTVIEDRTVRPPASEGLQLPPFPEAELGAYVRARAEAVARRFSERARAESIEAKERLVSVWCLVVAGLSIIIINRKSVDFPSLSFGLLHCP